MVHTRGTQAVTLISLSCIAWLLMMLTHELGHVLAAWATGGRMTQIVWHPLVFSRTDVSPNPRPGIVVWAGPIVGVTLPLIVFGLARWLWPSVAYLVGFVAGFCLIANGLYIGAGWIDRIGDAGDMLRTGTPIVAMVIFGGMTLVAGLWLWHRVSPRFGFGPGRHAVPRAHAIGAAGLAGLLLAISFVLGNPG